MLTADDRLLRRLSSPPPLDEALAARRFWHERARSLPWHRRAERREAARLAAEWDARVRAAARREVLWAPRDAIGALASVWAGRAVRWAGRVVVAGAALVFAAGAAAGALLEALF